MDKISKRLGTFGTGPTLSQRLYAFSVEMTLRFYERWILPQETMNGSPRISLKEIKLKEFRDRKSYSIPIKRSN